MKLHACPCCGSYTLMERGVFEICRICDWEDDPAQAQDPDLRGGANGPSLAEARETWRKHKEQG